MAWLEERHPQFENFVGICLMDADQRHCKSTNEQNLSCESCQLPAAAKVEKADVQQSCRKPADSYSSADIDLECGSVDFKAIGDKSEKDCRICFISLKDFSQELGVPIVLGCSCNGDLAFAHKKCAEKWFKLKGDNNCEICGSKVKNLIGFGDAGSTENSIKSGDNAAATTETQSVFHGRRLVTCILGGLFLIIVLCWLLGSHNLRILKLQ